jgi:formate/nitrite transporter
VTDPGKQAADHVKGPELVEAMSVAGETKALLSVSDMLLRGVLSGAILGLSVALVGTAVSQGASLWVGALVFPIGFVILVLFGFELVTGNFALHPVAVWKGRIGYGQLGRSWAWVFLGNLIGSVLFGAVLYVSLTSFGEADAGPLGDLIAEKAESKTLGYEEFGAAGMATAFVRGVLANWMVAFGCVMALVSRTVPGKIMGMWLPIFAFFAMGFEHSVVNMFVIPTGMMFGADVDIEQWWVWNQVPVTLGNIVGGAVCVGLVLYVTFGRPRLD